MTAAASAEEALERWDSADTTGDPFELVLMDWKMPGMDGFEASRRIRARSTGAQPTIVMVTSHDDDDLDGKLAQAGIQGLLLKPFTPSGLYDTIVSSLQRGADGTVVDARKGEWDIARIDELRGARAVVAEDNEINQQVAREYLENMGLEVVVAPDGNVAVTLVERGGVDVVLMDIQMPVMDGYTASRAIRAGGYDVPIIAMTANMLAGDREKALAAGMNDHVGKPIELDQLRAALLQWVRPRGAPKAPETTRAAPIVLPPSLPGLDVAKALRQVGGNAAFLRKLLDDFHKNHARDADLLRERLGAGDRDGATRIAHTLKGLGGTFGASRLEAAAGRVETLVRTGKESEDPTAIEACAGRAGRDCPRSGHARTGRIEGTRGVDVGRRARDAPPPPAGTREGDESRRRVGRPGRRPPLGRVAPPGLARSGSQGLRQFRVRRGGCPHRDRALVVPRRRPMTTEPDNQRRVLVVDDERLNVEVLVSLLRDEYKMMVAKNGEQALRIVNGDVRPDLVLLDIMMPDMDGYEVCRRLKELPHAREIPVVFVSAMGEELDEMRGLAVGGVDYITKPISPPIVQARVRTHLALYDHAQQLKALVAQLEAQARSWLRSTRASSVA